MADSFRLQPGNLRWQFAEFLERLALDKVDRDEWESFVICHYPDEFLEEMRRCTVRLSIGELSCTVESHEGKSLLKAWAIAVRSAADEDA